MKRRSQSIYLQLLTDKHAPEHYRYNVHSRANLNVSLAIFIMHFKGKSSVLSEVDLHLQY